MYMQGRLSTRDAGTASLVSSPLFLIPSRVYMSVPIHVAPALRLPLLSPRCCIPSLAPTPSPHHRSPTSRPFHDTAELNMSRLISASGANSKDYFDVGTAARTGLILLDHSSKMAKGAPKKPAAAKAAASAAASATADAAAVARRLQSQMRVQGRTAYIAAWPGSDAPAGFEGEVLALAFLARALPKAGPMATFVQKLAVWVGGGPKQAAAGGLSVCLSEGLASMASATLAAYDESRGSTAPNVNVTATAVNFTPNGTAATPGKLMLGAQFSGHSGVLYAESSTPWGQLPRNVNRLTFEALGNGEVSVAAGLRFTPAQLLPFPSYRGIWVERVMQTEAARGNLVAVPQSEIVTISIQITTPDYLGRVVVEVLMPGGLEPIDPNVYRDVASAIQCGFGDSGGGDGCGYRCYSRWYWCPAVEVRPSNVTVRYSTLPAGTASVSFKAVAATMGTFALPPVKAYVVDQPEVMGLSAAGLFTVCPARQPVAATPPVSDPGFGVDYGDVSSGAPVGADVSVFGPVPEVCKTPGGANRAPVTAAKGCPKDCSSNGVCNLSTGKCLCNQGFAGADCGKAAAS